MLINEIEIVFFSSKFDMESSSILFHKHHNDKYLILITLIRAILPV